jgi:hypothetical protein
VWYVSRLGVHHSNLHRSAIAIWVCVKPSCLMRCVVRSYILTLFVGSAYYVQFPSLSCLYFTTSLAGVPEWEIPLLSQDLMQDGLLCGISCILSLNGEEDLFRC